MSLHRVPKHVPRLCHYGLHGRDVHAYQILYVSLGYRDRRLRKGRFGKATVAETKRFQQAHHLDDDGVIGEKTYQAMVGHLERLGYAARLLRAWVRRHRPHPPPIQLFVAFCYQAIHDAASWHYAELRPYPRPDHYTIPVTTDCSGSIEMLARLAGLPDPSGFGYNGSGNTDSQWAHGTSLSRADERVGGLVLYYANGGHVVVYLGDERWFSHGSEAGPYLLSTYRYRPDVRGYRWSFR